ncbi:MAG TPA: NYN domain-containing protein [Candidatus Limnocylindria bacterium]|nr:NYN domain-containing protein [Candidatus Limnocylindria bacterium]
MASGRGKKKQVAVFIDGSNFYFKMKSLVPHKMDLIRYRYHDLMKAFLNQDETISYIGYYIGVVRDDGKHKRNQKAQTLRRHQQQLFAQLSKQKVEVVRGYLLERDDRFFEKGVDVRLAVDIVTMAFEKKYDTAFVVSSDTDLIPAMQKAQSYKKEIVHIGFEHQPSLALIRYATRSRLITRGDAEKFVAKPFKIRRFDEN